VERISPKVIFRGRLERASAVEARTGPGGKYSATEPNGQEYQCPSLQFQAIASAASSSRVTISSGSKAISAHARLKLALASTHAPNAQLQNTQMRLRVD